jgi:hypothetical protein
MTRASIFSIDAQLDTVVPHCGLKQCCETGTVRPGLALLCGGCRHRIDPAFAFSGNDDFKEVS